jgi:hypothetical protein
MPGAGNFKHVAINGPNIEVQGRFMDVEQGRHKVFITLAGPRDGSCQQREQTTVSDPWTTVFPNAASTYGPENTLVVVAGLIFDTRKVNPEPPFVWADALPLESIDDIPKSQASQIALGAEPFDPASDA